jgi:hypothetical protein
MNRIHTWVIDQWRWILRSTTSARVAEWYFGVI